MFTYECLALIVLHFGVYLIVVLSQMARSI